MEYYLLIALFVIICSSVATDAPGKVIGIILYGMAPYAVFLFLFLNNFSFDISFVASLCTRLITIIIAKKYI